MQAIFFIAFLLIGAFQFFAIWDALEIGVGVGSFIGFIGAALLTYVPLIGSAVGVYGANAIWGWELLPALALFFWYVPVGVVFMAAGFFSPRQ